MRIVTYPLAVALLLAGPISHSANQMQGEIQLEAATRVERDAGVWLDNQIEVLRNQFSQFAEEDG